jgi:hypothetical protein
MRYGVSSVVTLIFGQIVQEFASPLVVKHPSWLVKLNQYFA